MGRKFNRKFKLSVEVNPDGALVGVPVSQMVGGQSAFLPGTETVSASNTSHIDIENPITVEFSINRDTLACANRASITLYNLNENTRNQLFKDRYDISFDRKRALQFSAGYADDAVDGGAQIPFNTLTGISQVLPMIFNGELWSCYSTRQGTDFKTVMEGYDGSSAFRDSYTSGTEGVAPAGVPLGTFVGGLAATFPGIQGVTVGPSFNTQISTRGLSVMGNTVDIIKELTFGRFFIDNNHAYILGDNEGTAGDITTLDVDNGLIGTPVRSETYVEATLLFEPRIRAGQLIYLSSQNLKYLNGQYKVMGIRHQGIISETTNGSCTTTVTLFNGLKFVQVG